MPKAVCHVCEQTFELAKVTFEESSGVVGDGSEEFYLIPEHDPVPGKAISEVRSSETGELIKEICRGSFCPAKNSVH